jgi:hypothetical protein
MENINFEENLSQIKLEKAKAVANMLNESWNGTRSYSNNAGSYVEGTKREIAENSNFKLEPKKNSFSIGVLETAIALNNTPFVELPEGRIFTEKYINAVAIRNICECSLVEGMIQELESFSWEDNAKRALNNLKKSHQRNIKELEVAKAAEQINTSAGRELFSGIVESMRNWLASENKITESLINDIKKYSFNATVKNLIDKLRVLEGKKENSLLIHTDSKNCEVKPIIAPSLVFENSSVFATSNRFFKSEGDRISVLSRGEASKLPARFLKAVLALDNPNVRINESGADFYIGRNKLSVLVDSDTDLKQVYYNGKRIPNDKTGFVLAMEFRNSLQNTNEIVEKAMSLINAVDYLAEVDFGKKIVSRIYEGVEANIFKIGKRVYVNKVNTAMSKNELLEGNGSQAVNLIREFLGFDISESMVDVLENEDKVLGIMKNDKNHIKSNLEIVDNEISKIEKAIQTNPRLQESEEILEAKNMLKKEQDVLKSKWNQINVEIERFEKGYKKVDVNESIGYPIDTEVKVRRSGANGRVIGVNGNSKTYTVMFENGRTGEFFFSDVVDINDQLADTDLDQYDGTFESKDSNLAKAPSKKTGASPKFIEDLKRSSLAKAPGNNSRSNTSDVENLKNHNLADFKFGSGRTPKDTKGASEDMELAVAPGKSAKNGAKFIQDLKDHNFASIKKSGRTADETSTIGEDMKLAKLPGYTAKTGARFIQDLNDHNLAESQQNKHIEKAPGGKKAKGKKFPTTLKKASLAKAPGNHRKDGKKDHESLNKAELSKAPKTKKK